MLMVVAIFSSTSAIFVGLDVTFSESSILSLCLVFLPTFEKMTFLEE